MSVEPEIWRTYSIQCYVILSHCGSASQEQHEKNIEFQQYKSGNKVKWDFKSITYVCELSDGIEREYVLNQMGKH